MSLHQSVRKSSIRYHLPRMSSESKRNHDAMYLGGTHIHLTQRNEFQNAPCVYSECIYRDGDVPTYFLSESHVCELHTACSSTASIICNAINQPKCQRGVDITLLDSLFGDSCIIHHHTVERSGCWNL